MHMSWFTCTTPSLSLLKIACTGQALKQDGFLQWLHEYAKWYTLTSALAKLPFSIVLSLRYFSVPGLISFQSEQAATQVLQPMQRV
jgi:hypothetical protein